MCLKWSTLAVLPSDMDSAGELKSAKIFSLLQTKMFLEETSRLELYGVVMTEVIELKGPWAYGRYLR